MNARAVPDDVWSGGGSAVVLAVLTTPLLVLTTQPGLTAGRILAHAGLNVAVIGLGVSLVLYVHWRLATHPAVAWLVAAVTAVATQAALLQSLYVAEPGRMTWAGGWMLLVHLGLCLALLAGAWLARRAVLPVDPLLLGLLLGLATAAMRWVLIDLAPPLTPGRGLTVALALALLVGGVAVARSISRAPGLPAWVVTRLGGGVGLLVVGEAVLHVSRGLGLGRHGVLLATACHVAAGAVLLATSIALLRYSIREGHRVVARLRSRVVELEEHNRAERARVHEIGATVAGISSASALMQDSETMAPGHRARLTEMLLSETARLERLLAGRDPSALGSVDLDEAIRPLVTRLGTRGVVIGWRPSDVQVRGRPDDVTEIVGILLENSARHAGGEGLTVDVRPGRDRVEIVVSDDGPGIAPDLRDSLFDWGVRGQHSTGQGIGLHIARQLVADQGGHLRLLPGPETGTSFVVELPAVRRTTHAVTGLAS